MSIRPPSGISSSQPGGHVIFPAVHWYSISLACRSHSLAQVRLISNSIQTPHHVPMVPEGASPFLSPVAKLLVWQLAVPAAGILGPIDAAFEQR